MSAVAARYARSARSSAADPTASLTLKELFAQLDRHVDPIPVEKITALAKRLELSRGDIRRWARFGDTCYQRNLIHSGPAYQALALCWRSGQRSPIHDHRGSACVVRVVEGIATETIFDLSPSGLIFATATHHREAGSVCGSVDADIHQMGNLQDASSDLISLHIYSPPLLAMRTYFLGDCVIGECDDAVRSAIRAKANYLGRKVSLNPALQNWRIAAAEPQPSDGPRVRDERAAKQRRDSKPRPRGEG